MLNGPYRATKLWNEIVSEFCHGMPLRKHRRQIRQYNDCFTARDAVDWLHQFLQQNPNFGPDVSRLQTIQLLSKLQQCNIICSVNEHNVVFTDNQDLYRFKCNYANPQFRTPLKSCNDAQDPVPASLSVEEKESIWKSVVLERLMSLLSLADLRDILDEIQVNPKYIAYNVTRVGAGGVVLSFRKSEEIPSWVTSAMKCLASWPKASGDESCLPKYSGFERDVFKVIKDYFLNLEEPLTTFGMYHVLMAIYERTKRLRARRSYNVPVKMCYETAFLTDQPVTRVISPCNSVSYISLSGISQKSAQGWIEQDEDKSTFAARSVSVDNFQNAQLADKRASFRDRLRHKFRSGFSSSTTSIATEPALATNGDNRYLKREGSRVSLRAKNVSNQSPATRCNPHRLASSPDITFETEWRRLVVECIRLALLLLAPDIRRNLHLLLRFMDKVSRNQQLRLDTNQSNHNLVLATFASTVLYPKKKSELKECSILALVSLMTEHQESIFNVPPELENDVRKRSEIICENKEGKKSSCLSYCEMVSREEYERQKNDGFEGAMIDLLKSIISNADMSEKDRAKKLKQFKKTYPEIYRKALPSEQLSDQRQTSQLLFKLRKFRALRI